MGADNKEVIRKGMVSVVMKLWRRFPLVLHKALRSGQVSAEIGFREVGRCCYGGLGILSYWNRDYKSRLAGN